jgi:protein TonB
VGLGLWAVYKQPQEEADEVAGAIAMELSPVVVSQRAETPEATVGPQNDEAVPTPPTTEKVDELKPLDIPQFEQSPLVPTAEVALPIAKPIKDVTPKDEELKEVRPENLVPQQTAAAQAMAPPQVSVTETKTLTASQIGEATKYSQAVLTFQKSIRLHVKKHQNFPAEAKERGEQGSTVVQFAIDRKGSLVSRSVQASSGSARLDDEALATLDRCNPFPLPPDQAPGDVLSFTLKIEFRIR